MWFSACIEKIKLNNGVVPQIRLVSTLFEEPMKVIDDSIQMSEILDCLAAFSCICLGGVMWMQETGKNHTCIFDFRYQFLSGQQQRSLWWRTHFWSGGLFVRCEFQSIQESLKHFPQGCSFVSGWQKNIPLHESLGAPKANRNFLSCT